MTRRDEDRHKENRLALILTVPASLFMIAFLIFAVVDDWKQQEETLKAQQATEKDAQEEPEALTIETPDPCDTGSIVIYANGGVYSFYGSFDIENDGKDGNEIIMTLDGYMEAEYTHGEPAVTEIYGP